MYHLHDSDLSWKSSPRVRELTNKQKHFSVNGYSCIHIIMFDSWVESHRITFTYKFGILTWISWRKKVSILNCFAVSFRFLSLLKSLVVSIFLGNHIALKIIGPCQKWTSLKLEWFPDKENAVKVLKEETIKTFKTFQSFLRFKVQPQFKQKDYYHGFWGKT